MFFRSLTITPLTGKLIHAFVKLAQKSTEHSVFVFKAFVDIAAKFIDIAPQIVALVHDSPFQIIKLSIDVVRSHGNAYTRTDANQ
jgi:hypothetical protein